MIVTGNIFLHAPELFKLNLLDNCSNYKGSHSLYFKLKQLSCKTVIKFALLGNFLSDFFAEVDIGY